MAVTRSIPFVLVTGAALVFALGLGVVLASPAVRITVEDPDGADITVALPGFVIGLALRVVPDAALAEGLEEARPWLEVAREAARALGEAGDATLVRIVQPGERVTIATQGGVLVIDVADDNGETVRIEMPLRTVDRIVRRLERAAARAVRPERTLAGTAAGTEPGTSM